MSRAQEKSTDQDTHFLRAAYDTLADAESTFGVAISVELLPTPRKGVFRLVMAAKRCPGPGVEQFIAGYSRDYPNASAQLFSAGLYQASVRFYHCIETALYREEAVYAQEEEMGA